MPSSSRVFAIFPNPATPIRSISANSEHMDCCPARSSGGRADALRTREPGESRRSRHVPGRLGISRVILPEHDWLGPRALGGILRPHGAPRRRRPDRGRVVLCLANACPSWRRLLDLSRCGSWACGRRSIVDARRRRCWVLPIDGMIAVWYAYTRLQPCAVAVATAIGRGWQDKRHRRGVGTARSVGHAARNRYQARRQAWQ